jgi:cytochrome c553
MRKAAGFLLVFLLTSLVAVIATANGDETVISHQAHQTAAHGPLIASCDVCHAVHGPGIFADILSLRKIEFKHPGGGLF